MLDPNAKGFSQKNFFIKLMEQQDPSTYTINSDRAGKLSVNFAAIKQQQMHNAVGFSLPTN